jgi:hypothetical protein
MMVTARSGRPYGATVLGALFVLALVAVVGSSVLAPVPVGGTVTVVVEATIRSPAPVLKGSEDTVLEADTTVSAAGVLEPVVNPFESFETAVGM